MVSENLVSKATWSCDALRDLLPFVQFKKREKHTWRSVTFKAATSLKVTPLHGCFSRFLNWTNDTKSRNASLYSIYQVLKSPHTNSHVIWQFLESLERVYILPALSSYPISKFFLSFGETSILRVAILEVKCLKVKYKWFYVFIAAKYLFVREKGQHLKRN